MLTFWRVAMLCFLGLSCFALLEIYRSVQTPDVYVLIDAGMACVDIPATALFEEHLAPVRDAKASHVRVIVAGLCITVATILGGLGWTFGALYGRQRIPTPLQSERRCALCGKVEELTS